MALTGGPDLSHPDSGIMRLSVLGHRPDPTGGLSFVSFNRTNSHLEKISRQCRRLHGSSNGSFQNALPLQGRGDALESLITRLGIIPVVSLPTATSLSATLEGYPSDRNIVTAAETVTYTGGTAPQVFTAPNSPAVAVAFTAGGNGQAVTATDSLDARAQGRALVDILP